MDCRKLAKRRNLGRRIRRGRSKREGENLRREEISTVFQINHLSGYISNAYLLACV